ncbi:MAG TPA: ScpA family protein [Candidatus Paceibacterota bacterium]|jgi:segregation and condensation protein A|nr:ScpA family protein [Candidatus Paceibacterota bacterium]
MLEEQYKIKTQVFEGPLELLLDLIEKRKLFINDISLSQVTDDFLSYIKEKENFPLGLSANFILVASTLLLIKSKSLLPSIELTEEEQGSIDDLERRLKELERIRELSLHVKSLFGKRIIFGRLQSRERKPVFAPDPAMTMANIVIAAQSVLNSLPKKEMKPEVTVKKIISLEETIDKLTARIAKSLKLSFRDFAGHGTDSALNHEKKVEVIVSFLAMLELAKQGIIAVSQNDLFDDIHMETESIGVPKYF